MYKKKVLIIEDNSNLRELYEMAFTATNHLVFTANDGLEGLATAAGCKPDVILLDLMMPNMDGFEVLEALKKNTSLTAVVAITSNLSDPQHVERALNNGADMFIKKADFTPYETVNEVKKYLQGGQRVETFIKEGFKQSFKVLVIEANRAELDLLVNACAKKGLETVAAKTGKSGVDLAVRQKPDLIFLDLALPDLSGLEVLKLLQKTANLGFCVVITTPQVSVIDQKELKKLGCVAFLSKVKNGPEQMAEWGIDYLEGAIELSD